MCEYYYKSTTMTQKKPTTSNFCLCACSGIFFFCCHTWRSFVCLFFLLDSKRSYVNGELAPKNKLTNNRTTNDGWKLKQIKINSFSLEYASPIVSFFLLFTLELSLRCSVCLSMCHRSCSVALFSFQLPHLPPRDGLHRLMFEFSSNSTPFKLSCRHLSLAIPCYTKSLVPVYIIYQSTLK